jgi:diacylglycerol kinase
MFKLTNELFNAYFVAEIDDHPMKKRLRAFSYAFTGLRTFFAETFHAKIHLVAALGVVVCGVWLGASAFEWAILLLCIALVFVAEMINSSLEYLVDLAQPNPHPLAKKAKDVAAAAVLIASLFSVSIAAILFIPKLYHQWM